MGYVYFLHFVIKVKRNFGLISLCWWNKICKMLLFLCGKGEYILTIWCEYVALVMEYGLNFIDVKTVAASEEPIILINFRSKICLKIDIWSSNCFTVYINMWILGLSEPFFVFAGRFLILEVLKPRWYDDGALWLTVIDFYLCRICSVVNWSFSVLCVKT